MINNKYFKQYLLLFLSAIAIAFSSIVRTDSAFATDYFNCFETGPNPAQCPEPVLTNSCPPQSRPERIKCCQGERESDEDYYVEKSNIFSFPGSWAPSYFKYTFPIEKKLEKILEILFLYRARFDRTKQKTKN